MTPEGRSEELYAVSCSYNPGTIESKWALEYMTPIEYVAFSMRDDVKVHGVEIYKYQKSVQRAATFPKASKHVFDGEEDE